VIVLEKVNLLLKEKKHITVFAFLALAAVVLFGRFLLPGQLEGLREAKKRLHELEELLAAYVELRENCTNRDLYAEIAAYEEKISELRANLPSSWDIPGFASELYRLLGKNGVHGHNLNFGEPAREGGLHYVTAEFSLRGEKESLYRFLSALERLPRKAEFTYFSLAQGEDGLYNADLILEIYMLPEQ